MSFVTTTANLLVATGTIHCIYGLIVPKLKEPLIRSIRDMSVTVPNINEQYARKCSFWFQIGGVLLIIQGLYIRSTSEVIPPLWFGWTISGLGLTGALLMPTSGFWLILFQGIRLVWGINKYANLE
jgi:Family of unknown function (DUF6463)